MRRFLILDEGVSQRVAGDLTHRGRNAKGVRHLKIADKDEPMLRRIANRFPNAVLVTSGDRMPADHAAVIVETKVTVATIDPQRDKAFKASEWHHEVVQRWAHVIEVQAAGTVRRYGLTTHREWTDRRRSHSDQPRFRAEKGIPAAAVADDTEGSSHPGPLQEGFPF